MAVISVLKILGKGLREQPKLNVLHRLLQLKQLTLTQTKHTEEGVELQQFSLPLPLTYLAPRCAQITSNDVVLEPSAGTRILAKFADLYGCHSVVNEWSDRD